METFERLYATLASWLHASGGVALVAAADNRPRCSHCGNLNEKASLACRGCGGSL